MNVNAVQQGDSCSAGVLLRQASYCLPQKQYSINAAGSCIVLNTYVRSQIFGSAVQQRLLHPCRVMLWASEQGTS